MLIPSQDRYIKDIFYGAEAWESRKKGPQFVNERGIQVAQPVAPDGKIREIDELDFEGSALQLGIEEMMKDALRQSKGNTITDSFSVSNVEKELASSQTAYFSEDASDDFDEDDNVKHPHNSALFSRLSSLADCHIDFACHILS